MRLRCPSVVCWSLLALAALGCKTDPADAPESRTGQSFKERPPVVLISIDTLRADRLPAYGFEGIETPAMDRLRADGVLFERAFSHVPLTLPSHLSVFSGLLPHHHGVRSNAGYSRDLEHLPSMVRWFDVLGYATGGAVSAYPLARVAGFGRDFDFYDDADNFELLRERELFQRPGMDTWKQAEPWLRRQADVPTPFFLFLHFFEPHYPYEASENPALEPYLGEIERVDGVLAMVLGTLDQLDLYDRALIILMSDHGEGLGDHGEEEHGMLLYRSTLQVPLIIKPPGGDIVGGDVAGRTVNSAVGLSDLWPTVAELLGDELGTELIAELDGRSLVPAIDGRDQTPRKIFAETLYPRLEMGWSELFSVVEGDKHLIAGPRAELYDLAKDPGQQRDLIAEDRREAARLRGAIDELGAAWQPPESTVDAEAEAALLALGYMGSASASLADATKSPRQHMAIYEDFRRGRRAFEAHDFAHAAELLQRTVDSDPGVVDAWLLLGKSRQHLDQPAAAIEAYVAGGPPSTRPVEIAGELKGLLERTGRASEMPEILSRFIARHPDALELRFFQAQAWMNLGRYGEALEVAEQAVMLDPSSADARYLQGLVKVRLDRWGEGEADFRAALDLDPDHPAALADLAAVLARRGAMAEAREIRRRAESASRTTAGT